MATGAADKAAIEPGAPVRLERGGVLLHDRLDKATVATTEPVEITAPLSAFVPVKGLDSLRVPASGISLATSHLPADTTGLASVSAGRRSLGTWLYLRYLAPFWR